MEDLAGCATDDLTGWVEKVDGEPVRQEGILDGHDIGAAEAEAMIMAARIQAGWITEADLAPEPEEDQPEADADSAAEPE
jgi:N utilization substance protein A